MQESMTYIIDFLKSRKSRKSRRKDVINYR